MQLGVFDYVNIWPVYYRFLFESPPPDFTLMSGKPNVLNRKLEEGDLSASCISSAAFPFLQDRIVLLPALCLATTGPAQSVLLASRIPLKQISGSKIFVTTSSSTSSILLQILFRLFEIDALFLPSNDPVADYEKEDTACLLIGDEALSFRFRSGAPYLYDLGELWWQQTHKPFVWAVWGLRKEAAAEASHVLQILADSRRKGLENLDAIAEAGSRKFGASLSFMKNYFRHFRYDLGKDEIEGLLLFYHLASRWGLAPPCDELRFAETGIRV